MNITETNAFLAWVAQHDPRVSSGPGAVEVWQWSLAEVRVEDAKQAVLDHYRANEAVPASAAGVRKRAQTIRATAEAQQRAIAPAAPVVASPHSYRRRNPAEWDRLFEEGRADANESRERNRARISSKGGGSGE